MAEKQKQVKFEKEGGKSNNEIIRTMPDYFRSGQYLKYRDLEPKRKPEKQGSTVVASNSLAPDKKNVVTGEKKSGMDLKYFYIGGGVLILVIIGIVVYIILNIRDNNKELRERAFKSQVDEERRRQEELRSAQEDLNRSTLSSEQEQSELLAQEERDKKRIDNISGIQASLERYFEKAGKYPENLIGGDSIVFNGVVFLDSIPLDPVTISRYSYTVAPADQLSYTLSFTLEKGIFGLGQGLLTVSSEQQLSVDGILTTIESKRKEGGEQQALYLPSLDTDQDGLTDIEETLLYTTDHKEFDSDHDTYSDKQELLNLYNPFGIAPIRLLDSDNVYEYENKSFSYKIYYPKKWVYKALDGSNREVIFTSTTGEFIEVLIEDNVEKLSLVDWFKKHVGDDEHKQSQRAFTDKNLLDGIRTFDRKTVYFGDEKLIYIITHNIGNKNLIDYGATFEMMLRSFRLFNSDADIKKLEVDNVKNSNSVEDDDDKRSA